MKILARTGAKGEPMATPSKIAKYISEKVFITDEKLQPTYIDI